MASDRAAGNLRDVIRVLVVDDHPAVRAGIEAVLGVAPDIEPVALCGGATEAEQLAAELEPEVAVVDYELGDGNGVELCLRFGRGGPRTLVYSAYSERALAAACQLAGAGGLLNKGSGGDELCDAIRCVARGVRLFPPLSRDVLEACASRLDPEDLPILGMTIEGGSRGDIAEALRIDERALDRRIEAMVRLLRPATGSLARLTRSG